MFSDLGAQVIQADLIARETMAPGEPVYHEVVQHFGKGILEADGRINRSKLAAVAFGTGRIHELNGLVHPAVIRMQEQWMTEREATDPQSVAIVEAALIFEAGIARCFDKLVVVTAPASLRIERFVRRMRAISGVSPASDEALRADALRRMSAQMPEGEKIAAADFVIDNSGSLGATRREVEQVYRKLESAARATY